MTTMSPASGSSAEDASPATACSSRGLGPFVWGSAVLFGTGAALGVAASGTLPQTSAGVAGAIQGFVGMLRDLSPFELFAFIFVNNALKTFVMMFAGVVLGLAPAVFLLFNGLAAAIVVVQLSPSLGGLVTAVALLPHGVLEIPAVVLGAAVGLRLGLEGVRRLRGSSRSLKPHAAEALRIFVRVLVPLFVVAAAVEVWITPVLIALVVA